MKEINAQKILEIPLIIKDGQKIEGDKIDLKREWSSLDNNKPNQVEFCKDVSAIANTPGLSGRIIIGIDEKTGEIFDSRFSKSGLKDETHLHGILVKNVRPTPNFHLREIEIDDEGIKKVVSIIEIPPSLEKPHMIKNYKGMGWYTPIRKGTGTHPASPSDVDFMYYDRKNIEPDYHLEIERWQSSLEFNIHGSQNEPELEVAARLVFQNKGRRPIVVNSSKLQLNHSIDIWRNSSEFIGDWWAFTVRDLSNWFPVPFVIGSNNTDVIKMTYKFKKVLTKPVADQILRDFRNMTEYSFDIKVNSITGESFEETFKFKKA